MIKGVGAAALIIMLGAAAAVAADDPFFELNGVVAVANPATKHAGGITETFNPCAEPHFDLGNLNGTDGRWLLLPAGSGGRSAVLDFDKDDTVDAVDMDVWFYDDRCELITSEMDENAYSMATLETSLPKQEEGIIPGAAKWAIVTMPVGNSNKFTFTIP